MTVFLVLGSLGVVVLVLGLVLGDVFEGILEGAGGSVSTEVVGAFFGALGFGGAIALSLTGSTAVALIAGMLAGLGLAVMAGWASRRLRKGDHTGTVRTTDLIERRATVVNDIPADGYGVVSLAIGGHITRVNAKCAQPMSAGTTVVVVEVLSPTSVTVVPLFEP